MSDPMRAVIFDLDGVLVDSYNAHFESWKRLAAEQGYAFSEDQFADAFGKSTGPIESAPGKLILVGCSHMFRKDYAFGSNMEFFMNCIDALAFGDDFIAARTGPVVPPK